MPVGRLLVEQVQNCDMTDQQISQGGDSPDYTLSSDAKVKTVNGKMGWALELQIPLEKL